MKVYIKGEKVEEKGIPFALLSPHSLCRCISGQHIGSIFLIGLQVAFKLPGIDIGESFHPGAGLDSLKMCTFIPFKEGESLTLEQGTRGVG